MDDKSCSNGMQSIDGAGQISVPTEKAKATLQKYRHVAAVHSRPRTSCLSHDSDAAPSFLGFRNLMVIVLSGFTFKRSFDSDTQSLGEM